MPIVFISATAEDLAPYRVAARDAAIEAEFLPRTMEYFEARSDYPPLEACLAKVIDADVVVLIIAHRYGWVPLQQPGNHNKSITWLECEHAIANGKEVLAFLVDPDHSWPIEHREEYRATAALLGKQTVTSELVEDIRRNLAGLADLKRWANNLGLSATFTTPDDLRSKVAHALRKWADRHGVSHPGPPSLSASPEKYLRWLLARTAFIDIRGLQVGSGRAHRFPVEDLFVSLGALPPRGTGGGMVDVGAPDEGSPFAMSDNVFSQIFDAPDEHRVAPLQDALSQHRLIILGDPGSGKTTFLNRITSALCRAHLGDDARAAESLGLSSAPFPVLIKVSELTEYIRQVRASAVPHPALANSPEWIAHFVEATSKGNEATLSAAALRGKLTLGPCLLLVDGLDEAPDRPTRELIARLLENFASAFPKVAMVVTSRPGAYEGASVLNYFAHTRIEPLDDAQIARFLHRWCAALYGESSTDMVQHESELGRALRTRLDIRRMARTPVMLTALAVVHWNERRLPEQRADLYDSVITWLARSRENRQDRPTADHAVALLAELALAMQEHPRGRQVQISRREGAQSIAKEWREERDGRDALRQAERFLEAEELDSGIVVRRGEDIRFWHLTFQEFLAAKAVAGRLDTDQWHVLKRDGRLWRSEWREVVILLGGLLHKQGRAKVDAFLGTMLRSVSDTARRIDTARCVSLVAAIVRDLAPFKYEPSDEKYREMLHMLGIFDRAGAADVPIGHRMDAADALGQAGDPRLDAGRDDRYVRIPKSSLLMGAQAVNQLEPNFDRHARPNESPVHEVEVDAFAIGRYPVTVAEYARFIEDDGYKNKRWWTDGSFGEWAQPNQWVDQSQYQNSPVVGVSWFEAAAYAAWIGGRLPTEAEWERAARGTDGRIYPWGNQPVEAEKLNFAGYLRRPTPVGIFPLGGGPDDIQDMAGNVWEWCRDYYHERYYVSSPSNNPPGPGSGSHRVVRGASWVNHDVRSAIREARLPQDRELTLGFRIVLPEVDKR